VRKKNHNEEEREQLDWLRIQIQIQKTEFLQNSEFQDLISDFEYPWD
jgi:hypothetical protein